MPPKKRIYPIFLPHAGCPFQCIYCNQNAVASGFAKESDPVEIARTSLNKYSETVSGSGAAGEVAFYGGTFTALPREVMEAILQMAARFVAAGVFSGIRFSTRPDCLEAGICDILSRYPVKTVELGVQSMSDRVLSASRRGYEAQAVLDAAGRVRQYDWTLGVQLMAGLPEDTSESFLDSVKATIAIDTDFVRIYPALVFSGTRLADWFAEGAYRPWSLEHAVKSVAVAYDLFLRAGIPVIRMGLHSDPALEKPGVVVGGPHHPSFGQLVRCRWWRDRVDKKLAGLSSLAGGDFTLNVASNLMSDVIGPARSNIEHWKSAWKIRSLKVAGRDALGGMEISIIRNQDGEVLYDDRGKEFKTI